MPSKPFVMTLSLLVLSFLAILAFSSDADSASFSEPMVSKVGSELGVSSLSFSDGGFSFQLRTAGFQDRVSGNFTVQGLAEVSRNPGEPSIPIYSTYIALPADKKAIIEVTSTKPTIIDSITIEPLVPYLAIPDTKHFPLTNLTDNRYFLGAVASNNLEVKNQLFPGYSFELSSPMNVRGVRVARLVLYPAQYNPALKKLELSEVLDINIRFQPDLDGKEKVEFDSGPLNDSLMTNLILNQEQFYQWERPAKGRYTTSNVWFSDSDTYKIELNEDGIYDISYDLLANAGMFVSDVDPSSIEMMYRGETIAYQFLGDQDDLFEPGEKIRFYGWEFRGSRLERQFIENNVFWLKSGGSPSIIPDISSVTGDPIVSLTTTVTNEPENAWFPGYTDNWDSFPNEPDAWFWELLATSSLPLTRTYQVLLENPATNGPPAKYTVELSSRGIFNGPPVSHTAVISMNNYTETASSTWQNEQNLNVYGEVPTNELNDGLNNFTITASTAGIVYPNPSACTPCVALNRITVDYLQELIAVNEELTFTDDSAGTREFRIRGFSQPSPEEAIIWDVTYPRIPTSILTDTMTVEGSGPYTYIFGSEHLANSRFVITKNAKVRSPLKITQYNPPNLAPEAGGAEWLAIAYEEFVSDTNRLAGHRENAQFGGLTTHVVDAEDVINQYGYGLPLPGAIKEYLNDAITQWDAAPKYALLVGDATRDPRHLRPDWLDEQYLPTDLVFVDPWQGQIPSDLTTALLIGNDLLPDISLGRLAVQNTQQLDAVIDKIIQYEQNQLSSLAWMQNLIFIGDDADSGGDFCLANHLASEKLPNSMNDVHLCLDDYSGSNSEKGDAFRADIFTQINEIGTTIVNYRGHGAISNWGGAPVIMSANDLSAFDNPSRPVVAITGDCLDGKFTSPPTQGLGESLLRAKNDSGLGVAAAAHWGSSGLGLASEHSKIIEALYEGFFENGLTALGDAVSYAKIKYAMLPGYAPSLLYSFVLQGDPAMQIMRPALNIESDAEPGFVKEGEIVEINITLENEGVYPSHAIVTHEIPAGLGFLFANTSVPSNIVYSGNEVAFDLQFGNGPQNKGIPRNESVSVSITAVVEPSISLGKLTMESGVVATGMEAWPGNEIDYSEIYAVKNSSFIPLVVR